MVIIDSDIPYIRGRVEPFDEVVYVDQNGFTPELVKDAQAMIIRTRTRCNEHLLKHSAVKLIATATIGMDQFDLPWCEANGIECVNSPGCNAPAVAQYVWSCLLRKGFNPQTGTLGIVGCGHVGEIVADWGEKLGCRILVNDPPKFENGELKYPHTPLHELLKEADAVTLHTPMIKGGPHPSYHLIGEEELALMKRGALLVNAARGPVVDNTALAATSHLRLIIDTWEGEPNMNPEVLRKAEIATFHIAGYSSQGKSRATRMTLEALGRRFGWDIDLSGLEPDYTVPTRIEAKTIVESFDPIPVDKLLREHPEMFDTLRADYILRSEPELPTK